MIHHNWKQLNAALSDLPLSRPSGPCCSDTSHLLQRDEAQRYLRLDSFTPQEQAKLLLEVTNCHGTMLTNSFLGPELKQFRWHDGVLGEFEPNKAEAIRKTVRYVPYEQMNPLAFNSATLAPPLLEAGRAAWITATMLQHFVKQGSTRDVEGLVANVSRTAFEVLCRHYGVDTPATEAFFDDNATMALYQALGQMRVRADRVVGTAVTLFDTGRVMPKALEGKNPEFEKDNFHPAIDVWGNRERARTEHAHLHTWECDLINHYTDRYLSDDEIAQQALLIMDTKRPEVIVIPTVTRTGRRIAFIELCESLKARSREIGYEPLIILDDAQGLGRMTPSRYCTRSDGRHVNLWSYADGVLLTGAKVTGALMGSGAILLNRDVFQKQAVPFGTSPLSYRARQYAFMSDDQARIADYNRSAPGVAQTPEIASLTAALGRLPKPDEVYTMMRALREFVVDVLKTVPGIKVLEPEGASKVKFEDSIVAFYLEGYPSDGDAQRFRSCLAEPRDLGKPQWDGLPITLPAVITADRRAYLRLALDPARAVDPTESYFVKVNYVIKAIEAITKNHFPPKTGSLPG